MPTKGVRPMPETDLSPLLNKRIRWTEVRHGVTYRFEGRAFGAEYSDGRVTFLLVAVGKINRWVGRFMDPQESDHAD
jgi:hypothetical protein